jgi:15-cis-phytoene synthase
MDALVASSYRAARRTARSRARNFYFGIRLLPRERRDALCAIYAFMRQADDIADDAGDLQQRREGLANWRAVLDRTFDEDFSGSPICASFYDAVTRYRIPAEYFHELISGAEMDLSISRYRTFDELRQYCYRVASVVGLCSLQVFGFTDPAAKELAERCGIAFQLTNILRDIREDACNGRVYLPEDELSQFGIDASSFPARKVDAGFINLIHFEAARARRYYEQSWPLIGLVEPESRPALWTMVAIYRRLLEKIDDDPARLLQRRVSLPVREKLSFAVRAIGMKTKLRLGLCAEGMRDWQPLA